MEDLSTGLSAVRLELHQQMDASARTSALLDSMATVLTGSPRAAQPPVRSIPVAKAVPPRPTPAAKQRGGANDENLDSALDRVFPTGNN